MKTSWSQGCEPWIYGTALKCRGFGREIGGAGHKGASALPESCFSLHGRISRQPTENVGKSASSCGSSPSRTRV